MIQAGSFMATLSTIKQNKDNWGELLIENGRFITIYDGEALAQLIKGRLLLFRGEYYLNVNKGLDYNNILGAKTPPTEQEVIEVIEDLGYGLGVISINIELRTDRKLTITFVAESDFGAITGGI